MSVINGTNSIDSFNRFRENKYPFLTNLGVWLRLAECNEPERAHQLATYLDWYYDERGLQQLRDNKQFGPAKPILPPDAAINWSLYHALALPSHASDYSPLYLVRVVSDVRP